MKNKVKTILGLSLGTREIGFAVFRNGEFLNWGIKTYSGTWSNEKLKSIIEDIYKLVDNYQITHSVLKIPSTSSNSLLNLISKIEKLANDNAVIMEAFSLKEILTLCPEIGKNKKSIMEFITRHYPVFLTEMEKEGQNFNPYYIKMFEAASASILFTKDKIK